MTSTAYSQPVTIEVKFPEELSADGIILYATRTWQLDAAAQEAFALVRSKHALEINQVISVLEQALRRGGVHAALALLVLAVASTDHTFHATLERLVQEVGLAPGLDSVVDGYIKETDPFSAPRVFTADDFV